MRRVVTSNAPSPKPSCSYPYLFLNSGSLTLESFQKSAGATLGFTQAPSAEVLGKIRRLCPAPIRGSVATTDTLFCTEDGDDFTHNVIRQFGNAEEMEELDENYPEIGQETADDFSNAITIWIKQVNELCPLLFAIGPGRKEPDDTDPWHLWSRQKLAKQFVPFIDELRHH